MTEPISFAFEPTILGDHAHVKVWCGPGEVPDSGRGLCGTLVMRRHEWHLLRWLLATTPPLEIPFEERYTRVLTGGAAGAGRRVPVNDEPIVVRPDRMAEIYGERIDAAREEIAARGLGVAAAGEATP